MVTQTNRALNLEISRVADGRGVYHLAWRPRLP